MELVVGRVLNVSDHPGARAPSFLLELDLGGQGRREAQMEPGSYSKDELVGRQVVVSISADAPIVLAARSHGGGPILLRPDRDVEDGTIVA